MFLQNRSNASGGQEDKCFKHKAVVTTVPQLVLVTLDYCWLLFKMACLPRPWGTHVENKQTVVS